MGDRSGEVGLLDWDCGLLDWDCGLRIADCWVEIAAKPVESVGRRIPDFREQLMVNFAVNDQCAVRVVRAGSTRGD